MGDEYSIDEIKRALEFVEALGELCETHGFYLDCHSPMFVEKIGAQTDGSANIDRLFEVVYRDGYALQRHYT